MPPFSIRRPRQFLASLRANRAWLVGFGTETAGWLVYVAALRLAPLALVQAVCASGIAVLAFATARGHPTRLASREQIAVVVAMAGLVLLALSLVDTTQVDHTPAGWPVAVWLGGSALAAVTLLAFPHRLARGPALGLAAGLLFAGGDISAKLIVYGGGWLLAFVPLVVYYALGTSVLQAAFQHSNALTAAGLATLVTNAVPHRRRVRRLRRAAAGRCAGPAPGRRVRVPRRQRSTSCALASIGCTAGPGRQIRGGPRRN